MKSEGLTYRQEANSIVAYAFRNTHLENLHFKCKGFTDTEMKRLMIECCKKMEILLRLKDRDLKGYNEFIKWNSDVYCNPWEGSNTENKK